MGHSCQLEKLKKLEEFYEGAEAINWLLPFVQDTEKELILSKKETPQFKVYYRDQHTRSMVLLGTVTERRRKERKNNLKDLLNKAIMDHWDHVKDPSTVFLLGS